MFHQETAASYKLSLAMVSKGGVKGGEVSVLHDLPYSAKALHSHSLPRPV